MSRVWWAGRVGSVFGWAVLVALVAGLLRPGITVSIDSDLPGTRFAVISDTRLARQVPVLQTPVTFRTRGSDLAAVFVAEDSEDRLTVSVRGGPWIIGPRARVSGVRTAEIDVSENHVGLRAGLDSEGKVRWPRAKSPGDVSIQFSGDLVCKHPTAAFYARRALLQSAHATCHGSGPELVDLSTETPGR